MGQRSSISTKEYLIKSPLPDHKDTYTVLPHQLLIDKTLEQLAVNGFSVEHELYKCNLNARVAHGTYRIKYGGDPEIGMAFTWTNSYDKSTRFKSAIGAYIYLSKGLMISGNMGQWRRKHTGNADNEAAATIAEQISNAESYFSELVTDKNKMKEIHLDKKRIAEFIGYLYLDKNVITTEQVSFIKGQYKQPDFQHDIPDTSLWLAYNYLVLASQRAHPRQWLDQQRMIHYLVTQEFGIRTYEDDSNNTSEEIEPVKTNQITLMDEIAERGAAPHMP